ncbi:MAG: asparagine synthase (glutamine-hydrolyzing) [Planctomycetota bacterium]
MCGFFGLIAATGEHAGLAEDRVRAVSDVLAHRGPDGEGVERFDDGVLIHRRLAVLDPTPAGRQPFRRGGGWLVYNGELYNDRELRTDLADAFETECDTETVAAALQRWGTKALARFRGMFALAWWDREKRTLTLARDPLGIKPLYWSRAGDAIAFASEPTALFASGVVEPKPDPVGVASYLVTIRTTLGRRTMFKGVEQVEPGEVLEFDLSKPGSEPRRSSWWDRAGSENDGDLRTIVEDSIRAHLRSDVPLCSLLSGGLDSTIVASVAARTDADLRTYCSGAPDAADGLADDFGFAEHASAALGTAHRAVPVDRDRFTRDWAWMVDRLGVPLSTPNEVAIHAVARALRDEGHVVTLSGEGADELFAGYELPMTLARQFFEQRPDATARDHGRFQLESTAWIGEGVRGQVLAGQMIDGIEAAAAWYGETFAKLPEPDLGESSLERALHRHLRFQRRVNLAGLLHRLDTATMLASVEGRTPLADRVIAAASDAIPLGEKLRFDGDRVETKRCLRSAFAGTLPREIVERPKRSFPLPFQGWLAVHARVLVETPWLRTVFREPALAEVASDTERHWNLAWPMINLGLLARRWGWDG